MTYSYFICRSCDRKSDTMYLTTDRYIPTRIELEENPGMSHIAGELLKCKCGVTNTWFNMREIMEQR